MGENKKMCPKADFTNESKERMKKMEFEDYGIKKYLKLLSKEYKNVEEVSEEIINLQAILNLPKGTELFLSDLHGEYDYFEHILNHGAGIIRRKIETIFGNTIGENQRKELATLIYYPEEKLDLVKQSEENMEEWYNIILYRLIQVCKNVSSKYTRSKVRKALPKGFDYILDELIHIPEDSKNKEQYYKQIIKSIIDIRRADAFIIALSNLIKKLSIDHLHVLGDIYDRGQRPELILEELYKFHSLDIQWGNHDVLWMGAFLGNEACIANVIRNCVRYDNLDTLEEGYGISLRELSSFAQKTYAKDECDSFKPKLLEYDNSTNSDKATISKIHKAIAIICLKLEGNLILKHPEYNMDDRLLLDKIDYANGIINLNGKQYKLNDKNFPTINTNNPYELTAEEIEVLSKLKTSFMQSQRLEKHIQFLYSKGGMYQKYNGNLLFHGCVPMTNEGEFAKVTVLGKTLKGKELFDYIEQICRKAYKLSDNLKTNEEEIDCMWWICTSKDSPLFGKDKQTTFERYFLNDKILHVEKYNPYYEYTADENVCKKILDNFGLKQEDSKIINGHVDNISKGPIRANGKIITINGGLTEKYQKEKNASRYLLTYNSYGLLLTEVEKFEDKVSAINNGIDVKSEIKLKKEVSTRKLVADTDSGEKIKAQITDLKMLLRCYREGIIKEEI